MLRGYTAATIQNYVSVTHEFGAPKAVRKLLVAIIKM